MKKYEVIWQKGADYIADEIEANHFHLSSSSWVSFFGDNGTMMIAAFTNWVSVKEIKE